MQPPCENANPLIETRGAGYETTAATAVLAFVLLPIFGICLGFVVMQMTNATLESRMPVGTSVGPYASEGIPISMPTCLLMGIAIGLALAFVVVQLRLTAVAVLFLASFLGWFKTSSEWSRYVATNSGGFAQKFLFYPPTVLVVISCLIGGATGLLVALRVVKTREREFVLAVKSNLHRWSQPNDVSSFLLVALLAIFTPIIIVFLFQLGAGAPHIEDIVSYQVDYFHHNILFQIEALLITLGLAFFLLFCSQIRGKRWLAFLLLFVHVPLAFVLFYVRNLGGFHWWN